MPIDDIEGIRQVLSKYKTVAMVGLSANWNRPSNFAAKYLLDHGYKVIPVNPAYPEVLGQVCYPSLSAIPEKVDIVDIFRKPQDVPPIVEEAIEIGAKCIWLQLGVINHEAVQRAEQAGLETVMDRCMKIEFARLFGGLNFIGVNTKIISSKRPRTLPY